MTSATKHADWKTATSKQLVDNLVKTDKVRTGPYIFLNSGNADGLHVALLLDSETRLLQVLDLSTAVRRLTVSLADWALEMDCENYLKRLPYPVCN